MATVQQVSDKQVQDILDVIGSVLVESMVDEMLTVQPGFKHDLGEDSPLVNSVSYQTSIKEQTVTLYAFDYLKFVEAGRRIHSQWVPIDRLRMWAQRKGLRPLPGQTENSMLYAIRQHIWNTSLPGRPFATKTLNVAERAVPKVIQTVNIQALFKAL